MKIKLTEDQARRLDILNKDNNPVVTLQEFVKMKIPVINKIYSKVTQLTISDILNHDMSDDLKVFNDDLDKMDDKVSSLRTGAYNYLESMSDDEYEQGMDVIVDDAYEMLYNKISALQFIFLHLGHLNDLNPTHGVLDKFKDNEPLDITNS